VSGKHDPFKAPISKPIAHPLPRFAWPGWIKAMNRSIVVGPMAGSAPSRRNLEALPAPVLAELLDRAEQRPCRDAAAPWRLATWPAAEGASEPPQEVRKKSAWRPIARSKHLVDSRKRQSSICELGSPAPSHFPERCRKAESGPRLRVAGGFLELGDGVMDRCSDQHRRP